MTGNQLRQSPTGHAFSEAAWLDTHFEACRAEYEATFRSVGLQPSWSVLDAGCGSGSYVPWLANAVGETGRVTTLDIDPANVAMVRKRTTREWSMPCPVDAIVGSVANLPFPNAHFDAVWCANTTQYLPNDDLLATLREFRRVVRPGGLVVIKDVDPYHFVLNPAPPGLLRRHLETALGMPEHNPAAGLFRVWEMPRLLAAVGLKPRTHTTSLIERRPPLRPIERAYLTHYLAGIAAIVLTIKLEILPDNDLDVWRTLRDPDAAQHPVDHPDFYWCEGQAISIAQVPDHRENRSPG